MTCICRPNEHNPYCRACEPGGLGLIEVLETAADAIVELNFAMNGYELRAPNGGGPLFTAVRELQLMLIEREDAMFSSRAFQLGSVVRGVAPPRCFPKVPHPTQGAALAQLRSLLNRGLEKDVTRIRVYKCFDCQQWHVGHGRKG